MLVTTRSLVATFATIVTALSPAMMRSRPQADARASLLVTPAWLKQHQNDRNLVLLHVGDKSEYAASHIAGARLIDMDDLAAPHDMTPGVRMLEMPSDDSLRGRLAQFGISDDSRIIVYFGKDWVSPSTRIVLTLEHAGLGGATSIVDGGMPAWVAAGFPTTTAVPEARKGKLSALKTKPVVVTGEWVRENAGKPGVALIDARNTVFYDGVRDGGPPGAQKKGHIPGAKNVPYDTVWTDKNVLRSPAELNEIFAKAGVRPGDTIVGYCHIGQQATAMLFAARSLGYKVMLYDGSFEDWAIRGWPVEVPPKKGS